MALVAFAPVGTSASLDVRGRLGQRLSRRRIRLPRQAQTRMCQRARLPPEKDDINSNNTHPIISEPLRILPTSPFAWLKLALASIGIFAGTSTLIPTQRRLPTPEPVRADTVIQLEPSEPIPLRAFGIKEKDYCGDRELRARKTTQYSEAEEEIMELEEYEVGTQWFRDLQRLWAGLASIAGIMVLYRGGVLWERWIQEQERKDMEEEIKLTGTFISPRAVRKDENEDDKRDGKKGQKGGGSGGGDGDDKPPPVVGDIDGLNRMLK